VEQTTGVLSDDTVYYWRHNSEELKQLEGDELKVPLAPSHCALVATKHDCARC
jgi:hypothetical protein